MTKTKLRIISLTVAILGVIGIIIGTVFYTKDLVVHPDTIMTVFNDTTNRKTQAYGIGDLQVYIDQTYRADLPLFIMQVKAVGDEYTNGNFTGLDNLDESYSFTQGHDDYDINPFIMKLKIKNVNDIPREIRASDFKIRNGEDTFYSPIDKWQTVLAEAGFFAGTGNQMVLQPGEEKVLWLVFGTPSEEKADGAVYQEYVRMNYGSQFDSLATKVEFPFNYTLGEPIGDYGEIMNAAYDKALLAVIAWLVIVGTVYYRKKRKFDLEDEFE